MNSERIRLFRDAAREIAAIARKPVFYEECASELAYAECLDDRSEHAAAAREAMRADGGSLGHGFDHAQRVAIEAAAIVRCEAGSRPDCDRLAEDALVAGYLHDIRRAERRHAEEGAEYAAEFLLGRIDPEDREIIVFAIRNHEAFRETEPAPTDRAELLSGALYDADKFSWGPDNFTDTVWDMAESMSIDPALIIGRYDEGVRGIIRIKESFRTTTGRRYGPDFIDRGLFIGECLLARFRENMEDFSC